MASLTQDELRKRLDYNGFTGAFNWLPCPTASSSWNTRYAGKAAGVKNALGYQVIRLGSKLYTAHRLAWLWMTGSWPQELDHINGAKDDNRWINLRIATRVQNMRNMRKGRYKGVSWDERRGNYRCYIVQNGKQQHLGTFSHESDAAACYNLHAAYFFGPYASLNTIESYPHD